MKPQYDNIVMSSMFLWLKHTIIKKGDGYINQTGTYYPLTQNLFNGLYTYALPYKSIVDDNSIVGAIIPSGVYVNGVYTPVGSGGLSGIDYQQGQVYFDSPISAPITGSFSITEVDILITDLPEEKLLFETQLQQRPFAIEQLTGLGTNVQSYPIIYIKNNGGDNRPFAFGGQDNTVMSVRALCFLDSQFALDAVGSIMRDTARLNMPLIYDYEMPFNSLGYYRSGNLYNYDAVVANKTSDQDFVFISKVYITPFSQRTSFLNEVKGLDQKIYVGIVDFTLEKPRYPRLS